ncbi:MAG: 16S rRNA (uracil(1498)-N(3))-methyltransferase [Candidatus Calescibacterium sp.]|nr:16S rRNA (uracil(1498)-N(3))-methyltransferase [Candidatus Calescibacterium sp.]MCX7734736.1 16S rRNA (uracil(1498)-N(3))-methyltransferase [bacterium]MDW8087282.1 RsmE family RNA methyltransferase [Candidatus Calescibacterium sp.]
MKKIRALRQDGEIVFLDPQHTKVLRIEPDETVKVLLPDGVFAIAKVTDTQKALAQIIQTLPPIKHKYAIYFVLPLLKKQHTETAVEFLSQIGVEKIIPVVTERSEVRPTFEKKRKIVQRFMKISAENARVSGVKVPQINDVVELKDIPKILDSEQVESRIVFWENSKNDFDLATLKGVKQKVAFIVGPEGGLSEIEINYLQKSGFSDFNLGDRIIKAEFFPIYICSVIDFILNYNEY